MPRNCSHDILPSFIHECGCQCSGKTEEGATPQLQHLVCKSHLKSVLHANFHHKIHNHFMIANTEVFFQLTWVTLRQEQNGIIFTS